MKRIYYVVLASVLTLNVFAQKGEKAIGINLGYGTEIKSMGIGAKFNYGITDPIRLSPSFNYFFGEGGSGMWELNADMHYLFPIADKLTVYPLAGLSFSGVKVGFDEDDFEGMEEYYEDLSGSSTTSTQFGLNLGGGIGYQVTDKISVGAELKYSLVSDFDQMVLFANVMYKF